MTFTYFVTAADWARIAPELILAFMMLVVMLVDLILPRPGTQPARSSASAGPTNFAVLPGLSLLGLVGAFVATIVLFTSGDQQRAFYAMIGADFGSLYAYI